MDFKDTAHQRIWKVMQYLRDQQAISRQQRFNIELRSIADEGISEQDFFSILKLLQDDGIIFSDSSHPFWGPVSVSIEMYPEAMAEYMEDFKKKNSEPKTSPIVENSKGEIYFDPDTGKGLLNDKEFSLRIGSKMFIIFAELYKRMGKPLRDTEVKVLIRGKSSGMYIMNDIAGKLRKKIGLTTEYLVQNKGGLTLVTKKKKL